MNIFKKIGSFASTSWKDFSELYGDQQMLEVSLKKEEGGDENDQTVITSSSESGGDGSSFELRKRPEMEIAAKKNGQGFFRRHFSKRKLKQQIQLVDDPRSPTTAFARTPIQAFEVAERGKIFYNKVLFIFNSKCISIYSRHFVSLQCSRHAKHGKVGR